MNEEIPLTEFFVLNVIEKKKLGEILKYLPQMPTWANHLKRIKSGNVLIQPLSFPIDEILRLKLINVFGEIFTFERVLVPSRKPITRQQFTWAKQRWPVEFHPNKNVEAMLNGTFFDKKQQKEIINFFLEAEKVFSWFFYFLFDSFYNYYFSFNIVLLVLLYFYVALKI